MIAEISGEMWRLCHSGALLRETALRGDKALRKPWAQVEAYMTGMPCMYDSAQLRNANGHAIRVAADPTAPAPPHEVRLPEEYGPLLRALIRFNAAEPWAKIQIRAISVAGIRDDGTPDSIPCVAVTCGEQVLMVAATVRPSWMGRKVDMRGQRVRS